MRLRLEAEGISTFMENARMGSGSMFQVATGGTTLKVPVDQLADARVILDQDWTIPASDDQIDNDDDWAGLDAEAGFERRRRIMKAVIWFMVAPSLLAFAVGIIAVVVLLLRGLIGLVPG